jgi:signal transduction histidine kinase
MSAELTRSSWQFSLLTALLITLTFTVDYITGYEIAISIFYLIPIGIATWFLSRRAGLVVSVLCAGLWLLGEQLAGAVYSNELIQWWNMLVRLGFFVLVTQTLATRRRVESELRAARTQALVASRAKTEFVSRVTHELRTPLTAIVGFADIVARRAGPYLTFDDQECLRRIRANSETLLHMVDHVLEVGRTEARRHAPRIEPVDVASTVRSVTGDLRDRPRADVVELIVEEPDALMPIETDPVLLRQILLNLVGNALKFTEDGYVRVRIMTNGEGTPSAVVVEDTGIGIPTDKLKAIFEPFEQADGSIHRRFGGTGLGLAIAKDLCEQLGYRLEVESRLGAGSKFTVLFGQGRRGTALGS